MAAPRSLQRLTGRLGPPGSALRRVRLALLLALAVLLACGLGPLAPWRFPGEPTLVPGPDQSRIHTVLVATGWASLANAALCALLLLGSGRWARAPRWSGSGGAPRATRAGAAFWLLILAAVVLTGALRWPLVRGSVWWDEAWSLRHTVVGRLEPDADRRRLVFAPVPWLDTLWKYRQPTNHVAYSVAARFSHAGWRALSGAPRSAFDEVALRLPAWLAALASVALLGLLVRALGFPMAAPAAAFLLAIHPWHVRYGADGRGYSFVVLATLASALLLLRALREDRWRWWLGSAAAGAFLLWTFPLAVHVPLSLTAAAALAIARGPREGRGRLARLLVANVLAGMAYLQIMAPNLAQAVLLERLLGEEARFDRVWIRQIWVAATTGLQLRMPRVEGLELPSLASLAKARPWLPFAVYAALPAVALAGALRAIRRGGAAERAVLLGLCCAPLLMVLHRAWDGFFAYPRFLIYALVPVATLLAVGSEGMLRAMLRTPQLRRAGVPLGLAALLAGYQWALLPLTRVLLRFPQAPAREVAEFIARQPGRGADTHDAKGALRIGVGHGGDVPRVYDPWIEHVTEAEDLAAACARAREEGRALYVFYGHAALNRRRFPETMALLGAPGLFETLARFDAIESEHVYRVLRYTGAPLVPSAPGVSGIPPAR
jgi:Dolichyl-phosphate-mannose-protein mannosyltransferase